MGEAFTINSLNFRGTGSGATGPITIGSGGGNLLTINGAGVNGNTTGNGIFLDVGNGAVLINSPLALGGSQTWTNNSASLLTVASPTITGSGMNLSLAGSGDITISGAIQTGTGTFTMNGTGVATFSGTTANTYSGLTTVNSGTLRLGKTGVDASAGNAPVAGGTLQLLASNQINNASSVRASPVAASLSARSTKRSPACSSRAARSPAAPAS